MVDQFVLSVLSTQSVCVCCAVSWNSVVLIEGQKPDGVPDRQHCGRMKLLQFHENYRPAYWGTWSKKTSVVSPRCPFRQDKVRPRATIISLSLVSRLSNVLSSSCVPRNCWTMRLTVMKNGRRKSQGNLFLTVKGSVSSRP